MAKTETTVKGYVYTVTSPNGGTVTDAEGKLNKTVDAGDQVTVTAPSDSLTCDDDDAVICKATFKSPLLALRLLGQGTNALPAGYTRLEFLESTGTQWVTTGVVPTSRAGFRVRLSGPLTSGTGWGYLMGTQNASGGTRFYLAHSTRYVAGFGADVLSSVQNAENEWVEVNYKSSGKFKIGGASISLQPLNFESLYEFLLFRMAYRGNSPSDPTKPIRVFAFELTEDAKIVCNVVPSLDPTGTPCMYDLVSRKPFRNAGSGQFIVGLTLSQAAQLGRKLPSIGGKLTISLPEGYEQNEAVVNSLSEAEAKGWVLTIQTYVAETAAATFALRRVWVRRVQDEYGSYVAADGSRWQVEWCVDVIGADPESLGYERFRSVDAAVGYWALQPYVDPEPMDDIMGDNGTLEQGDTDNTSPEQNS